MRICIKVGILAIALATGGAAYSPALNPPPLAETNDVFWSSAPVAPGAIAILYGNNLAVPSVGLAPITQRGRGVPPARQPTGLNLRSVTTIQSGPTSLKFSVPKDFPPGLYAVQLDGSRPLTILNRPQAYWAQGEGGHRAWRGGWVRILGRNLTCSSGAPFVYLHGATARQLAASGDEFSLKTQVPAALPLGVYKLYVHNGCGGWSGWSDSTEIEIAAQPTDPAPVISVKDAGAVGDGLRDDTAAIETLLGKLASLGGGTAYFPPGAYRVVRTLDIPAQVVVRGSARDTTYIRWDVDPQVRLDAAIRGSHDFAIEDTSLVFPVSRVRHGIISGMPWRSTTVFDSTTPLQVIGGLAGNIRLSRLRIDWRPDAASICDPPINDCLGAAYGARGFLLLLGGRNIRVEDNILRSAETVANLVGADDLLFARNDSVVGERGWAFNLAGGERVIVENNQFMGTADSRSGMTLWASEPNRNAYIARNRIENITFHDCEGFSTDGAQGRYFGPIASATTDTVTLPAGSTWSAPLDQISSTTCYIIGGKGEGQYRHIVSGACTKDPKLGVSCTAQVDRPWNVVPDATSQIGINHTVDHLLLVGNSVLNAFDMQVYGSGYEVILANNEVIDSAGLASYASRYPGNSKTVFDTQPQFFIQWLHNRVSGGRPLACPRWRESKWGMRVVAATALDEGWWNTGTTPALWPWTMIRGFVVRGNSGFNEAGITVATVSGGSPLLRDLVIENNTLSLNDVGVVIPGRVAGVVTAGNTFQHIPTPFRVSDCPGVEIHEGLTPARPLPGCVPGIGPTGTVSDPNPTYRWSGDTCDVGYYELAVDKIPSPDTGHGGGHTVFRSTYTRVQAGCAGGGMCAVRPTSPDSALAPAIYEAWIRAVNQQGTPAWDGSCEGTRFVVR